MSDYSRPVGQTYALEVCPHCRALLRFADCSDEGMADRAKCCDRWWLHAADDGKWGKSGGGALLIYAVEIER